MAQLILVINPGSTSTKLALFDGGKMLAERGIDHPAEKLAACDGLTAQLPMRTEAVRGFLADCGVKTSDLSAIACRGGTFGKVEGGAYMVNDALLRDCETPLTQHPSNLAARIGHALGHEAGIPAYIYDAVCADETRPLARYSGLPELPRKTNCHVLNSKAVCRAAARGMGAEYENLRFVVAHLGGGISLSAHEGGRIVDAVSDDEGPMSPERAGRLNSVKLIRYCFSSGMSAKELEGAVKGRGGLLAHLGTSDLREVERRIDTGDKKAAEMLDVMAYQISKGIGELAAALCGRVDAVILTGGCAYCKPLTDKIRERVEFIAPVKLMPGSLEMQALAEGVSRVLNGEERAKNYEGRDKNAQNTR